MNYRKTRVWREYGDDSIIIIHYNIKIAKKPYVSKNFYNLIICLTKSGIRELSNPLYRRSPLRHGRYVKITKKDYDKTPEIFTIMLFNEFFDEKSYKMAIYKSRKRVYNKTPE